MIKKTRKPVDLPAQRMLIIDDNESAQRIIKAILRSWNVQDIRIASDGAEGLEILKSWTPNLIITDWSMGPMNGETFVTRLRNVKNGDLGKTPVLVVTGHSSGPVVKSALNAGANQIVAKPLEPNLLLFRIQWTLQDRRAFTQSGDRFVLPTIIHNGTSASHSSAVNKAHEDVSEDVEKAAWLID